MEITYKRIADLIECIVDPNEELEYNISTIENLLSFLRKEETHAITMSDNSKEDIEEPLIQIETHPNPQAMTFHVKKKINDTLVIDISNKQVLDWRKKDLQPIAYDITNALLDIEGVYEVNVNKYYITVRKAKMFSWEELQDAIFNIIKERLFREDTVVVDNLTREIEL
jgi:hypothetical protein